VRRLYQSCSDLISEAYVNAIDDNCPYQEYFLPNLNNLFWNVCPPNSFLVLLHASKASNHNVDMQYEVVLLMCHIFPIVFFRKVAQRPGRLHCTIFQDSRYIIVPINDVILLRFNFVLTDNQTKYECWFSNSSQNPSNRL
jgi:hypothetical protein